MGSHSTPTNSVATATRRLTELLEKRGHEAPPESAVPKLRRPAGRFELVFNHARHTVGLELQEIAEAVRFSGYPPRNASPYCRHVLEALEGRLRP